MTVTRPKSIWLTLEGVLLIVLGFLALVSPLIAGLAVALLLGWLLVMVGVLGLIAAFAGRAHAHVGWGVASAAVALLAGIFLLFAPLAGAVGLTILIGAYLLLDGISLIGYSLDQRKRGARAWGWLLSCGILDLLLAALILPLGGIGSTLLIGIVVGIDLIVAGIALLVLHRAGGHVIAGWVDPGTTPPRA